MKLLEVHRLRRPRPFVLAGLLALTLVVTTTSSSRAEEPCTFVRGDTNGIDGPSGPVVDLNDAVDILAFLFLGRSIPPCLDAADTNDNGLVELSDFTYLVEFLFHDGPAPPAPFPAAGTDTTPAITVSADRDARFEFRIGTSAGIPSTTGIEIPVTISNSEPITGLSMLFTFRADQVRIDELFTEENTLLSAESAEYIIAETRNADGVAFISALKDFATPFSFHDGSDPYFPAGEDQLVATLRCGVLVSADMGFAPLSFTDGVKIPNSPAFDGLVPESHNLVYLGSTAVRPTLGEGGGIDIRRGFIRGDANKDDGVDISDSVFLLSYIFQGGRAPPCADAADANNDTRMDISDPIWLLNYLFKGGPQPSEPFPQAGVDPSDDGGGSLGCESDG